MKYVLLATSLAFGLAMQPALADTQDGAKTTDPANQAETIHAPTNRVGEMVPTMTSPENTDDAEADGGNGDGNRAETLHAPTNRVGDQVPTMTAPEKGSQ